MRTTLIFLATAVLAARLLSQASNAQAQGKPAAPPRNPFMAQSNNCIAHGNSAQTDSTVDPGPVGPTRKLTADEVRYHDLGMFNLPYLISGPYPDGKRVVWTNGTQFLTKLDYDSFDVIAQLRLPGDDHADTLTHENFIKALDADVPFKEKFETAKKSGDPALYGIYTLIDKDNQYVVAGKGFVRVYGDAVEGDRNSGIVVKANWDQPKDISGTFIGMNMTFDGRIILATTDGHIIALSRDFKDVKTIRLPNAEAELAKQPKGVEWIRNSFSIDEKGGIYVASHSHLHKVIWTGDKLSVDAKDGAWHERYRNSLGRGTGATPTLVGFGDEPDKLVVLTDGDALMNVTLYWRDEIPAGWKQLKDAPSRRIAGLLPATFGDPDRKAAQSEQSMVCSGYGMFVVNNEPRNVPQEILDDPRAKIVFLGYLSYMKEYQPFGGEKFEWDPKSKTLMSAWANTEVSSPNCVPFVSTGSNMVYLSGARENQWTLEGIDWTTGTSTFHYILGGARFNSFYSQPVIDADGRVMASGLYGAMRIQPNKK